MRGDEGKGPAPVNGRPCTLGRFDLCRHRHGLGFVLQSELPEDALVRIARLVDRRYQHVPGDAGDPQRPRQRDGPGQRPLPAEHEKQHHGGVPESRQGGEPAFLAFRTATERDCVANSVDREPCGEHEPECMGREVGRVDREERDHHADERAGAGLPPGLGGRAPEAMKRFEAGGDCQEPPNSRHRVLRVAEGRQEGQERQRHHQQSHRSDGPLLGSQVRESREKAHRDGTD
jgi:hypothetical protein